MMSPQTVQVFSGIAITLFYFLVVLMFGMGLWKVLVPHRGGQGDINSFQSIEAGWLSFILGQGVLAFVWLVVAMSKNFYAGMVWTICCGALGFGLWALRKDMIQVAVAVRESLRRTRRSLLNRSLYSCLALVMCGVVVMKGVTALAPTDNFDALMWYLASPLSIATTHGLELQPHLSPHNGLYPLQVEMHWAALFTMGNESAVLVWDYLCAVSFLAGVGILSGKAGQSRRVALVAMLVVLSIEGFFAWMGLGKTDNAASQYGIAAFLSLLASPTPGLRSLLLGGSFLGWSFASRYTNVILLPAMILGALWLGRTREDGSPAETNARQTVSRVGLSLLWIGVAASMTWAPMLVKNWMLVGCPFAPLVGCREAYWAQIFTYLKQGIPNISGLDLIFYPFVWTFAERKYMMGHLSPLFLGLIPLLFVRSIWNSLCPMVRLLGAMGLFSLVTWLFVEPTVLYTRWLLVPMALVAVPLGAAAVEAMESRAYGDRWARGLMIGGFLLMCMWLVFESRSMVYGIRYAIGRDHRDAVYADCPPDACRGYDSAKWLNENVEVGARIGLAAWSGYPLYFLRNEHLSYAENVSELQWLWNYGSSNSKRTEWKGSIFSWSPDTWTFYLDRGFSYVVIDNSQIDAAQQVWEKLMPEKPLAIVFACKHHTIVKISEL